MDIDGWRKKIDKVNSKLIELLNQRTQYAVEIGKIKKVKNLPVHDSMREGHILETVKNNNNGPLSNAALQRIFSVIMEETRKAE